MLPRVALQALRAHPGYAALAAYVLLYLSWQLFHWLPLEQASAGDLLFMPVALAATLLAWRASHRARKLPQLRRAWRWVASAITAQFLGGLVQSYYEYVSHSYPYPSAADVLYLSFYPLLLIGILSFPALRRRGNEALALFLDCAIVAVGGATVFAYLLLGHAVVTGSSTMEAAVTLAYPVGDLILLVALGAAVMRSSLAGVRESLRWLAGGVGLFIVGDLIFSYVIFHGGYEGGDPVDAIYVLAFACIAIAGSRQRAIADSSAVVPFAAGSRVSPLPYAAVVACLAILITEQGAPSAYPHVWIASMVAMVTSLLVVRQLVSLRSVRQSQSRLSQAQAVSHVGSWEWDVDQDRIEMSEEQARILGVDGSLALTHEQAMHLLHPEDRKRVTQLIAAALAEGEPFTAEFRIVRPSGEVRSVLGRCEVETRGGRTAVLRGTHHDITDRKRMEEQLRHQADHDPLTGLFNRRRFTRELDRALRYAARYERSGAVLMVDVDDFKFVNDAHGHPAGDTLLKSVGDTILTRARETDAVGRIGGDEFAIVLPEATEEGAVRVAEDIREALTRRSAARPAHLSVGIALFDHSSSMEPDEVLVAADFALYEAKESGKDQVRVFNGTGSTTITWVERIRAALAEERFILYAQPMIDIADGRVTHRELLIRMLSDDGDVIPPSAFLPTAERFGLSVEIDRWVSRQGLDLARRGERVSINLSASSIGDAVILDSVREAIAAGVEPSDVIFEITETAAMTNLDAARRFAEELTALGCGVALDDFGTGFGSFTYLKHLSTGYLKIDMEFVRELVANPTDRQVVKSITEVAHSLGKRTVAEGVEDEETLRALRRYGVDCAQGFFIGRPERISLRPPSELEQSVPPVKTEPPLQER